MRRVIFLCVAAFLWGQAIPGAAAEVTRRDYTAGTGAATGGFSSTWEDPDTGDINTTVIAPRPKEQEKGWPPIYVYPQVTPTWPPTPGGRPVDPSQGWPSPIAPVKPQGR